MLSTYAIPMAAIATVLALAGCSSDPAAPAATPVTAPASSSPGSPPARTSPAGPGATPQPTAGEITVNGHIVPGVEPGCWLLRAAGRDYLLVFQEPARRALPTNGPVTVTGRLEPDLVTTCMQGIPLVVSGIDQ